MRKILFFKKKSALEGIIFVSSIQFIIFGYDNFLKYKNTIIEVRNINIGIISYQKYLNENFD